MQIGAAIMLPLTSSRLARRRGRGSTIKRNRQGESTQPDSALRLLRANRWTQGLSRERGERRDCWYQVLRPSQPEKSGLSERHKWLGGWHIPSGPRSRSTTPIGPASQRLLPHGHSSLGAFECL